MMNKKGFTIIEIIVCISLIVVIGIGSFVGIRLVDKHIKITKLSQMTNKILEATNVYLETDKEAKQELYNNKNGIIIPVKKLVNEGLVDLKNIKLNDKTDYVIALLGNEEELDKCTGVYTATQWDFGSGKTIYICTDKKGNSNLATIDPTKYSNKTYASNEPYYFRGIVQNNYVIFKNSGIECNETKLDNYESSISYYFRIYYIDRNDDIIVVSKNNLFSKCKDKNNNYLFNEQVDLEDVANAVSAESVVKNGERFITWLGWYSYLTFLEADSNRGTLEYKRYMRLPSTCKIVGGSGAIDKPFEIDGQN